MRRCPLNALRTGVPRLFSGAGKLPAPAARAGGGRGTGYAYAREGARTRGIDMSVLMSEPTIDDLTRWTRDWAVRFRASLAQRPDAPALDVLHEELDRLGASASAVGDEGMVDVAIELSVYLCSFAEEGRCPGPTQRAHMEALLRRLELAADVTATAPAHDTAPDTPVAATAASAAAADPIVLMVSTDSALVAELFISLAAQGLALVARESVAAAAALLGEGDVRCVLLDAPAVSGLPTFERRRKDLGLEGKPRPTTVALVRDGGLNERMQALQFGAEHVLQYGGDAQSLVERLDGILRQLGEAPLRVAVIDDDRSQSLFCGAVLRHAGFDSRLYATPGDALRDFAEFRPDVVLLDLYMPDVDGLTAAERLRRLPGAEFCAIVFLSGDQNAETRFEALASGGSDYLTKPILPRHLMMAVRGHGRRMRQLQARLAGRAAA